MAKSNRTSNDQRSTVKNPTSKEFKMDQLNTVKQIQGNKSGGIGVNDSEEDNNSTYLKDGELYFRFWI